MFTLSPEKVAKTNEGSILQRTLHRITGACISRFGSQELKLAYEQQEQSVWETQRQALFEEFTKLMEDFNGSGYMYALGDSIPEIELGPSLSADPITIINKLLFKLPCLPENTYDYAFSVLELDGRIISWETPRNLAQIVFEFRSNEVDELNANCLKGRFTMSLTKYKGGKYSIVLSSSMPSSYRVDDSKVPPNQFDIRTDFELALFLRDNKIEPIINRTTALINNWNPN